MQGTHVIVAYITITEAIKANNSNSRHENEANSKFIYPVSSKSCSTKRLISYETNIWRTRSVSHMAIYTL